MLYATLNVFTPIFTLLLVAASVGALGYLTSLDPAYTNQFLVLTGQRTREIRSLNSYSMQAVLGDDPKTRLYLCMMQAGIGQGALDCPTSTSVVGFRDCLKRIGKDCGAFSDGGYPRDSGFLQCVGTNFKTTSTMVNRFVQCEDLAESIMVDSVQTPYSTLFLGSYNLATLLLSTLAIMASFLVFTAGGFYSGGVIKTNSKFHIGGMFAPFSTLLNWIAMIWSVLFLVLAYAYSFPPDCDNVVCITKANAYPTTPWTGILSSMVFLGLSAYYGSFIFERYFENSSAVEGKVQSADVIDQSTKGYSSFLPGGPAPDNYSSSWGSFGSSRSNSFPQGQSTYPQPQSFDSGTVYKPQNERPSSYSPQNSSPWGPGTFPNNTFGSKLTFGRTSKYNRLSVQLRTNSASVPGQEETELFPLMAETFAWALIFVDGLLFLGMISPQNSPMHENVTIMFASITTCRLLQLAVAKFMNEAFVAKIDSASGGWRSTLDPKQFGIQVTLIFTYVASLGFLLIGLYNFMNANNVLWILSTDVKSPAWSVSFCFLMFVGIMPEIVRSIQFAIFCVRDVKSYDILLWTEVLFAWNWIFRFVFIIVAIFTVPAHLKEQSDAVMNFIGPIQYS